MESLGLLGLGIPRGATPDTVRCVGLSLCCEQLASCHNSFRFYPAPFKPIATSPYIATVAHPALVSCRYIQSWPCFPDLPAIFEAQHGQQQEQERQHCILLSMEQQRQQPNRRKRKSSPCQKPELALTGDIGALL